MADKLKIIYTYSIALVVVLGGLFIIYATRLDPATADVQGMRLLLAGFIGSALTFVFGRETAAGSAFQSERAYAAGLAAPTIPPTVTLATDAATATLSAPVPDAPQEPTDG